MKALITGATGLIGSALLAQLPGAVVLTRDPNKASGRAAGERAVRWNAAVDPAPLAALRGTDAIFHLAGEPVAEGRWTADKKKRIRDSRVQGTRNLVRGLAGLERQPDVLVCASAVGFYGDRGDEVLAEASPVGRGFLAEVCAEWEHEALKAEGLGMRVVCVRIGIVLAPGGGALARMLPPFKMGAGGRLGSGQQWMPWIHLDDVVGLILHASRTPSIRGPLNAASPAPVTNAEFTKVLGQVVHRPTVLPIPRTALRLAFGELSDVLLVSQRVLPQVAERTGYVFRYPNLNEALTAVVHAPDRTAA